MATKRNNRNNNNKKNKNPFLQNYVIPADMMAVAERMARLYNQSIMGYGKGLRPKAVAVSFDVLEQMAHRNPLVQAIIQKRTQQMRPYCTPAEDEDQRGFIIKPWGEKKGDKGRIRDLTQFFVETGFGLDPDREDDWYDFNQYMTRDILTFDQMATELQRTRKGDMFAFWYVDGTSISRLSEQSKDFAKGYRYAQRDNNGKICALFKRENLIFDYMNKRSRLKYRGYGFSPLEMMIDLVTTFLFSMSYNKDMFIQDKLPKGFLKIMGDVDKEVLDAVRDHWVSEMTGYGAKFGVPIVPSGKEGVGIDWQSLNQSNRDMEYYKLVMFIVALTCAVYSIDGAELGIKVDQQRSLIGERPEPRLDSSRSTGLGSLLAFKATIANKILRMTDPDYIYHVQGLHDDDQQKKMELLKDRLGNFDDIDSIRKKQGLKPYGQPWSKVPLNDKVVQLITAGHGGEGFEQGGGEEGGFPEDFDFEPGSEGEGEGGVEAGEEGGTSSGSEGEGSGGSAGEAGAEVASTGFEKSELNKAQNEFFEVVI